MKDVKDAKVLRDEIQDGVHFVVLDIQSDASIPKALQGLIKPEMIGWKQFGKWNISTGDYRVDVEPNFFKDVVKIQVNSTNAPRNGAKPGIDMHIRMETRVDVPLLGKLAETVINQKVMDSLVTQFKKDITRLP